MAITTNTKNAKNVTHPKGNKKGNILHPTKNTAIVTLYSGGISFYKTPVK